MGIPRSFPLMGLERFFLLIHTIPKIWDEWIPIVWKKYKKKETFQNYEVLKYFMWSRNPYNSQTTEWENSHIMGLVWEVHRQFPSSVIPYIYRVNRSTCNFQCLGMCKFLYHGNILQKAIHSYDPGRNIWNKME